MRSWLKKLILMIHLRWLKPAIYILNKPEVTTRVESIIRKGYGEQKYKVKNKDGRIEKKGQVMNGLDFLL